MRRPPDAPPPERRSPGGCPCVDARAHGKCPLSGAIFPRPLMPPFGGMNPPPRSEYRTHAATHRNAPYPAPPQRTAARGRGGTLRLALSARRARPAAIAVCGRSWPVPGPALFRGRSACGPPGRWPPAPLSPTRRPPRRPARAPGVRGSRSLRARVAVPSTVDALPLCPLLPGWPPGGRSAPGSRAPGRRGSPRRSRRRRSGPGGPRGAAAATGRLGSALPPRAGARPPVSVFLLRVPLGAWGRGPSLRPLWAEFPEFSALPRGHQQKRKKHV